jgi:hypothetical protein
MRQIFFMTLHLCLLSFQLLAANPEEEPPAMATHETTSLSSGGLSDEHPLLFNEPIDLHGFTPLDGDFNRRGLRVSDRYLKQGINTLNQWENQNYAHLTTVDVSRLKSYIETYEDSVLMSLNYDVGSELYLNKHAEVLQLTSVLDQMPLYRAKLYYPIALPKSVLNQLDQFQFKFPDYVVAPGHYLSADFKFGLLSQKLQPDEELVLVGIEETGRPISTFSTDPENIDFLWVAKDKAYEFSHQRAFKFGPYAKHVILKPSAPDSSKHMLDIYHHRDSSCQ